MVYFLCTVTDLERARVEQGVDLMAIPSRALAHLLTINAGSSSIKFALFQTGQEIVRVVST